MFRRREKQNSSEQVTRLTQEVRRARDLLAHRFADVTHEPAPAALGDRRTSGVLYQVFQALGSTAEV